MLIVKGYFDSVGRGIPYGLYEDAMEGINNLEALEEADDYLLATSILTLFLFTEIVEDAGYTEDDFPIMTPEDKASINARLLEEGTRLVNFMVSHGLDLDEIGPHGYRVRAWQLWGDLKRTA